MAQVVAAGQHGRVTALQLTGKYHRLGRLEPWQALHRPPAEMPGVPHACRLRRLHACDDVPHLACAQAPRGHRLWRQDTDLQGAAVLSACFAGSSGHGQSHGTIPELRMHAMSMWCCVSKVLHEQARHVLQQRQSRRWFVTAT